MQGIAYLRILISLLVTPMIVVFMIMIVCGVGLALIISVPSILTSGSFEVLNDGRMLSYATIFFAILMAPMFVVGMPTFTVLFAIIAAVTARKTGWSLTQSLNSAAFAIVPTTAVFFVVLLTKQPLLLAVLATVAFGSVAVIPAVLCGGAFWLLGLYGSPLARPENVLQMAFNTESSQRLGPSYPD